MAGSMEDVRIRESLEEKADELHKSLGLTEITVFDEHILGNLEKLSDRIEAILQEASLI